jgi:hypothetical protein
MATPAQIQAALATARANALSWGDKAMLLSMAIDNALVNGAGEVEMPIEIGGSDGTNWTRMKISEAAALVAKWKALDSGGIVGQLNEFWS